MTHVTEAIVETEVDRQALLDWEAEGIAKARDSVAVEYYATSVELNAWIDRIGTYHELPFPYSGR